MSILNLNVGEKAIIENIFGEEKLVKRLKCLGCIQGTEVILKNLAPFGDPIIIQLRGFSLAIRKKDAEKIYIKKI